jgi:hypothetical protein
MRPSHTSSVPDRAATFAGIVGALLAAVYLAIGLVDGTSREFASRAGVALTLFAGGVAVGWVGRRVGTVMSRVNDLSAQISASASDEASQTREILDRLGVIELALKQSSQQQRTRPSTYPVAEPGVPAVAAASEPALDPLPPVAAAAPGRPAAARIPSAPAAPTQSTGVDPALLARIMSELEELREIALMNDEQRQLRLSQHLEAKRRLVLDKVFVCFRTGQWAAADVMLTQLEVQYPNETRVKQARSEFFRLRTLAEPDALFNTEQRLRDLVHLSAWSRALALVNEFVNNFPASDDGRRLLAEVRREHEAAVDTEFQRRYEQVQSSMNRRMWRAALADAQRLLEEFPDHPRAGRLRSQLRTIHDNADIEERQEHEMQLQMLLESRQFAEAVAAAEEIVRRFPGSPQAEALIERLPQLRQLAATEAEPDLV